MSSVPFASIVVIARNEERNLPRLAEAFRQLKDPGWGFETILIDNGSSDKSFSLAQSLGFSKVLLAEEETVSACRNIGARAAEGQWIVFTDADCQPAPDWLLQAKQYMDQDRVFGWPVIPPDPPTWVQSAWHTHWTCKNPASLSKKPVEQGAHRLITTANLFIPSALFAQLGGFDETLTSGEDMNLLLRASQADMEVVAVPRLEVVHHGEPATLKEYYLQQLWHSNRGSFFQILKNKGLKSGGNAIVFTGLFACSGTLFVVSVISAIFVQNSVWLFGALPLVLLLLAPALLIAWRARRPRIVFQLLPLYFLYGLARTQDLIGLSGKKRSYRTSV